MVVMALALNPRYCFPWVLPLPADQATPPPFGPMNGMRKLIPGLSLTSRKSQPFGWSAGSPDLLLKYPGYAHATALASDGLTSPPWAYAQAVTPACDARPSAPMTRVFPPPTTLQSGVMHVAGIRSTTPSTWPVASSSRLPVN